MVQNRNKLVELFIGNLSNAIIHRILEKAIFDNPEMTVKYSKEIKTSWEIAKEYREKINPKATILPEKDAEEIKAKVAKKVKNELLLRISKGYKNINHNLIEPEINNALISLKIA